MKKVTFVAIAMGMLAFTACSEKKTQEAPQQPTEVETQVTDTAFQQKAAGAYKTPDGERVITLNSDLSVKTTNFDKEYYKWALVSKPESNTVEIQLIRKGLDADVTESATLNTDEGALIIKNETFRK